MDQKIFEFVDDYARLTPHTHKHTQTHNLKESTRWLATQHTLKFMSLQRKKLTLLKSLKIITVCILSARRFWRILCLYQTRKNTLNFSCNWSRESLCFQVYKKQQKKCLNSPIVIYFLKCVMKMEAWLGLSQSRKFRFYFVLTMKT